MGHSRTAEFPEINNVFFGMTAEGGSEGKGVIYKINPDSSGFSVLYSFNKSTGHNPHGKTDVRKRRTYCIRNHENRRSRRIGACVQL